MKNLNFFLHVTIEIELEIQIKIFIKGKYKKNVLTLCVKYSRYGHFYQV